jgi:YesN/AraC family two-component response regulator
MNRGFQGLVVAGHSSPLRGIRWDGAAFCAFRIASDGHGGLRVIAREKPDVVLLDLDLPDLPGLVVLRRIRRLVPDTPVLVFSRRPDLRSTVEVADLGVAGYLTPPMDGPSLLRRLGRLVSRLPRPSVHSPPPNPRARGLVEAALARARAPDGTRLSVAILAATLGVSAKCLRRSAREVYGIPIKTLLVKVRVQSALARLRETEEPIKAIAATLGFHDAAHLAHTVRRLTGIPPRRHREWARDDLPRWVATARATETAPFSNDKPHRDAAAGVELNRATAS